MVPLGARRAILVVAVFRVLVLPDQKTDFDRHCYVHAPHPAADPHLSRVQRAALLTRVKDDRGASRLMATPIVLVVLSAGLLDIVFAADSVPASSRSPGSRLAFTASTMAILGLRSLFWRLSEVVGRFRYLRVSVLFILLYVAGRCSCRGIRTCRRSSR